MANVTRSAVELAFDIRHGRRSPVEETDKTFDRIGQRNDELNAFVHLREDAAREEAADAERALDDGEPVGPLHGVPVALKDLDSHVEGMPYTLGGVAPIGELLPDATSVIVQRLQDAGAIVVGSTNSPEFGASGDTTNPMFGSTGNPFDSSKTAGGSSGGSASAVGSQMIPIALGSDVAGSLRIPASACGVYGLKPTPGTVPNASLPDLFRDVAPFVSYGGLTRTVEDTALLLATIAGEHSRDPLSVPDGGIDYLNAVERPIDELSIAFSSDLGVFEVESAVVDIVEGVADTLTAAGATVEPIDVELGLSLEVLLRSYDTLIESSMASSFESLKRGMNIDLMADHRDELSPHIVEYVERGREYSAVEYHQANVLRSRAYESIADVLDEYDLLLTPTLATPPFEKGERAPGAIDGTPVSTDKEAFLTWPFNLTGHPAASLPAGLSSEGLPIGAQLVGSRFAEDTVLAASGAVERRRPWADNYPPLS
ncbi:amidase [Halarchaeum nitratireducens]|uniref:Amidase n=2 Tax=Halarchaeum nitratireducens TaxID=489913 RepID=A0A830GCV6_9EURY|nr:amidase family protein [Halarchaeum solikamskense]MBP2251075.1 aspartyl-tRNA(Asn)/glutamyl-tRNA(Gln) amidotransferase subunit A [Halarchaeum solikamskense]GGN22059.1 amidase [Halarchaeum nitratireducens]